MKWRVFPLISCIFLLLALPAHGKSLISDISDHLITIDTSFLGTDILLFGARNDAGDIVVVVRGPKRSYIVRKRERIAGIWVNRKQVSFDNIDSFYAIASSRPLSALKNEELLAQLNLGVSNLPFSVSANQQITVTIADFKDALLTERQQSNLYGRYRQDLPFMGEVLFKITLRFPENIPRGTYTAETYLINNGQLTAMQSTPIVVKKIGADAFISDAAYQHPALYGIAAIILALFGGWLAGIIFRRV